MQKVVHAKTQREETVRLIFMYISREDLDSVRHVINNTSYMILITRLMGNDLKLWNEFP